MMDQDVFRGIVSIVIPVYNSEIYLKECIDSVIHQTFEQLQIIFIDDGSVDKSWQILKAYERSDDRIVVLKGNHAGAGAARNLGMDYACGKYIIFLDSDDVFETNMIEEMYQCAAQHQAEVTVCGFDTNMNRHDSDYVGNMEKLYLSSYSEKLFCLRDLPMNGFWMWGLPPWTKLYELDFLKRNHLQFQQIQSSNDKYFSVMSMIYASRMIHTLSYKALVHYRTNRNGQISARRKVIDAYMAWKKVYEEMQLYGVDERVRRQYYAWVLSDFIFELTRKGESWEEKKNFYHFFLQKGMQEIGLVHGLDWADIKEYRALWEQIQKNSFDSYWFQKKKGICFQLESKGVEEIKKLCQTKKVVLWGIGERGRAVLERLNREKIKLKGIVDSDVKKQGIELFGYQVQSYADLKNKTDIIIITSKTSCNAICSSIAQQNRNSVKILPLFLWLESARGIEECILELPCNK